MFVLQNRVDFLICKRLSKMYSEFTCALRSSDLEFSGKAYSSNECKNYKLNEDILNELKHYMAPSEEDEQFPSPYDEGVPF